MAYEDTLQSMLLNLAGTTAGKFGKSGPATLDRTQKYFETLLGGDREALMKAVSPEVNAVRSGADAAKKEQAAKGTARTGGTAEVNQQIEDEVRKQIDALIGKAQQSAAGELKGVGDSELNAMMSALGISTGTIQSDINSRREATSAMWAALIGGAGKIAAAAI